MTQAQLRAFIPLMLKFSTGEFFCFFFRFFRLNNWENRVQVEESPDGVKNLPDRLGGLEKYLGPMSGWMLARKTINKEWVLQYLLNSFHLFIFCLWWKVSWTHALRQIVINCYKYHGREDLLPAFSEDATEETSRPAKVIKTETEAEQQVDQTGDATTQQQSTPQQQQQQQQQPAPPPSSSQPAQHQQQSVQQLVQASPSNAAQYAPTVVQTISNPDGTVSIIQVGFSLSSILTFLIWFRCSCFLFFFHFFSYCHYLVSLSFVLLFLVTLIISRLWFQRISNSFRISPMACRHGWLYDFFYQFDLSFFSLDQEPNWFVFFSVFFFLRIVSITSWWTRMTRNSLK